MKRLSPGASSSAPPNGSKQAVAASPKDNAARNGSRSPNLDQLLDYLVSNYREHGLEPRTAALELSFRIAFAEMARQSLMIRRLLSRGSSKAFAQYAVLRDIYFSKNHCLSQAEIMRTNRGSSANVTRLIHGLERAGLVKRDVNPSDKRSTYVRLTADGLKLCEEVIPYVVESINDIGRPFTDAELVQFNEFLARLTAHLEHPEQRGGRTT